MNTPTAAQKRFHSATISLGSVVDNERYRLQLHHVLGRTARHNKVRIGQWYVLPLNVQYHDVSSNHEFNVTHRKKAFEAEFGQQAQLWVDRYERLMLEGLIDDCSPPDDVISAIDSLII